MQVALDARIVFYDLSMAEFGKYAAQWEVAGKDYLALHTNSGVGRV
jgi:hypothetical protein